MKRALLFTLIAVVVIPPAALALTSSEASAANGGLLANLLNALKPQPPAPSPTATPLAGYEPAEPGDRTSAGKPTLQRVLVGLLDDGLNAFSSTCSLSHSKPDDPIVYPSQPGASHLHEYFGNTTTDAYSTDDSLRSAATTTCSAPGDSAAYWVPALYQDGQRIEPSLVTAYYMSGNKDNTKVEPFPKGLKLLVKDDVSSMWSCAENGVFSMESKTPPSCPDGKHLALSISYPDCWDGKYLDVPDHRSHMAYAHERRCPSSHPVPVPMLSMNIEYERASGGSILLAPIENPSAPHADFINSWDQMKLSEFVRDCINAGVHCNGTS